MVWRLSSQPNMRARRALEVISTIRLFLMNLRQTEVSESRLQDSFLERQKSIRSEFGLPPQSGGCFLWTCSSGWGS